MMTCPDCSANLNEVPIGDPCPNCGGLRRDATVTPGFSGVGRVDFKAEAATASGTQVVNPELPPARIVEILESTEATLRITAPVNGAEDWLLEAYIDGDLVAMTTNPALSDAYLAIADEVVDAIARSGS